VTELASALAIKERQGDLEAEQTAAVWQEFSAFCGTRLRLVPVSRAAFAAAADLVRDARSGLRAGDALHLAVAREVGAVQIATLDSALAANAESQAIRPVVFADS
jgi:predicted nucleic acid-binding protein